MWMDKINEAVQYAKKRRINIYNWPDTIRNYTVVAFGLGKFFEDTHERLFNLCEVEYVSDNDKNKWGKEFYGKKCIKPKEIMKLDNPLVIVVMGNYIPVRDQMRQMRIPSMCITDLHMSEYIRGEKTDWLENELENIKTVIDLLEDDYSRDVFTTVFCNKIYGSETEHDYAEVFSDGEYFGTGILELMPGEVLIDAGAYIGDTVADVVQLTDGKFDKIYAYELSSENYAEMKKDILKYSENIQKKIETINAGVWDKKEELWCEHFGTLVGCQVVEEQLGEPAQLVALDEDIPEDATITMIKMDIEGSEQKAILGAKKIISRDKPKLAICLYHTADDMWKIPLLIKQINNSYKIYIRHHSMSKFAETVCYAYVEQ